MKKVLYISIILIASVAQSQNPSPKLKWQKTLGGSASEGAKSIVKSHSGKYLVAGTTQSMDGNISGKTINRYDAWVTQLSTDGGLEWEQRYGPDNINNKANSIITSGLGSVIVGVEKWHHAALGLYGANSSGTMIWEANVDPLNQGFENYYDVARLPNGDLIVVGVTLVYDVEQGDMFEQMIVRKHGSGGDVVWEKFIGKSPADERVRSVIVTPSFEIYVAGWGNPDSLLEGWSSNPIPPQYQPHGGKDVHIWKLSHTNGSIEWNRAYGGSGDEEAREIILTNTGLAVIGFTNSTDGNINITPGANHGGFDYWLLNLNLDGDIIWERTLGGTSNDYGFSVAQNGEGDFVVVGQSSSNDGHVTSTHSGNHGEEDMWAIKIANDYSKKWDISIGGSDDDKGYSIIWDEDEKQYVIAGETWSHDDDVLHGDPISGPAEPNPIVGNHGQFGRDFWIVALEETTKLDPTQCNYDVNLNGYFNIAAIPGGQNYSLKIEKMYGNPQYDYEIHNAPCSTCTTVAKSNFYILENYEYYLAYVSVDGGSWGEPCSLYTDPFAMYKKTRSNIGIEGLTVGVFPNPARQKEVKINFVGLKPRSNNISIKVLDLYGKQVYFKSFYSTETDFLLKINWDNNLASGIYMTHVVVNGKSFYQKLVIEN